MKTLILSGLLTIIAVLAVDSWLSKGDEAALRLIRRRGTCSGGRCG